ncbi:unnamed protein product [Phytophthora fragariaefolia]|uniref:Unnamed protein product n=1 Tax=Phytophthora fragariaefolia TaxID=1490495 RepID=A0A9W6XUM0_9STRA|nr:unnamed protein product [Phytophthora fragariaefolia]
MKVYFQRCYVGYFEVQGWFAHTQTENAQDRFSHNRTELRDPLPSYCEDTAHAMDEDASRAASPDAPPRTASDEEEVVDKHGILVSVKHASQNMFTLVWSFIHKLSTPTSDPL